LDVCEEFGWEESVSDRRLSPHGHWTQVRTGPNEYVGFCDNDPCTRVVEAETPSYRIRYLHGVRGMSWLRVRDWQHNNFGFRLLVNYR
jgi:hypothetical protein